MLIVVGNWWTFVLRGIAAVLFGVLTFIMPAMALLTLVFIFGFYAILDGVFNIVAAFHKNTAGKTPWWAMLLQGVIGLIAGAVALLWPGITAFALLMVIAAWAILTGAASIIAAFRLREHIKGEWLLGLSGALSIIFGILAVIFPGAGALAIVIWIGAYATVFGVMLIALGFRVRAWMQHHTGELPPQGLQAAPSH
jgi:uncharacterized membrane protein HdeD (DUF308 family)